MTLPLISRSTASNDAAFSEHLSGNRPASRLMWVAALNAILVFLALAIGFCFTRGPWWDEGLFADIALNFRNYGHLGSVLLAPNSYQNFPAVNHYTYWQFPVYLVSLGAWFRIAPQTVASMRLLSVLCGGVYIACWFFFVRGMNRDTPLALLVASAVALDYSCIGAASNGRMDMMCAAFGQAALAAYVCFRSSQRNLAMLLAGMFGAASLFCHPMGALMNVFLVIIVLQDVRHLRWPAAMLGLMPYLAALVAYFLYAAQAPQIFWAQATAASVYRISSFNALFENVFNDAYERYFRFYFANFSPITAVRGFAILFGVVGLVALIASKRLRATPLARTLLFFPAAGYLGIALLDNQKFTFYLIYSTPVFSACGAVWVYDTWRRPGLARILAVGLLLGFGAAAIGGFAFKIHRNDYLHVYQPTIAAIRHMTHSQDIIMGPSELGFALGFRPPLMDDCYLGYASGIRPRVYVMHSSCGSSVATQRAWDWSRRELAAAYELKATFGSYEIYLQKEPGEGSSQVFIRARK